MNNSTRRVIFSKDTPPSPSFSNSAHHVALNLNLKSANNTVSSCKVTPNQLITLFLAAHYRLATTTIAQQLNSLRQRTRVTSCNVLRCIKDV